MGFLRFLLALSVIASHSSAICGSMWLQANYAVEIFFMISGFYMSLILTDKYAGPKGTFIFVTNRALRIYPTYLVVLCVFWLYFAFVWTILGKMPANSWHASYTQMALFPKLLIICASWFLIGSDLVSMFHFSSKDGFLLLHGPPGNTADGAMWAGDLLTVPQAWSIGTEIWFYLLAPFFSRISNYMLILCFGLSCVIRFWLNVEVGWYGSYFVFPAQVCFFAAGMLLHRFYSSAYFKPTNRYISVVLMGAMLLLFYFYSHMPMLFREIIVFPAIGIAIPYLFNATRKSALDRNIGNLSYPMYLSHMLLFGMMQNAIKTNNGNILAIVCVATSFLLYRWIEKPVDLLRQRLVAGGKLA